MSSESKFSEPPTKKLKMASQQEINETISSTITSSIPISANTNTNTNTNTNSNPSIQPNTKEKVKSFTSKTHYITKYDMNSPNFEKYYKKQGIITDPIEWSLFLKTIKTELPTSFRFNPASKLHSIYKQKLLNDSFNLKKLNKFHRIFLIKLLILFVCILALSDKHNHKQTSTSKQS